MALFIVATGDPDFALQAEQEARAAWARHGLPQPSAIDLAGWRLLHAASIEGGADTLLIDGEDFVAAAGTPVVDGLMGTPALARLLAADMGASPDWQRVGGHFIAVMRRRGRTFLFGDCFGVFQLWHDAGERLFSTSLLAALGALPRVSFDTQGVYEWAFGVVTTGNDTPFAELKFLGPERLIELTPDGTVSHALSKPLTEPVRDVVPLEEQLKRNAAQLMRVVEAQVGAFGNRINCPLSGGMDSRLMLAALRAAGCTPSVYVYGPPNGADVRVSRAIGAAEGFPVEWIDKQADPIAPDAFPEQVERNFHELDGLPNFGNIFDNGVNAQARDLRHAGGALAVSGGGGEVYRDFFMLPDRAASAMTLVRCFNSRFVASDATDLFDPRAYQNRIADKVAEGLGSNDRDEKLPRLTLEQAFPRVRLRALFRWEMNIESRHGPYALTFLDPMLTDEAMKLPIAPKQCGRFEGMLINAIDPALARHMSAYGHDFAGPPGWKYRVDEGSTRHRPVWLRENMYRLKRKRGPMIDEHGGLLAPEYMSRVVDLDFPVMRRFFHVDRITDSGLWRRVACLEHLAGKLGGKLVG